MKVRLKRPKVKAPTPESADSRKATTGAQAARAGSISGASPMNAVWEFLDHCRLNITSLTSLGSYLCQRYQDVFGCQPPNAMLCLIKAKIAYRLQYLGMVKAGQKPTPRFLKNYEAAQKMQLEEFDADVRGLMEVSIKQEETKTAGEEKVIMKVKAKAKSAPAASKEKPEAKRGKVTRDYIALFEAQPKAKLTDAKLAAEMCRLNPEKKKYTPKDIATVRGLYNNGRLNGQSGKPKNRLEAYGVK